MLTYADVCRSSGASSSTSSTFSFSTHVSHPRHECVCVWWWWWGGAGCVDVYIHTYIHTYIYPHTHLYIYPHTLVYVYPCVCVWMCVYVHTHTHTHTRTHTHTACILPRYSFFAHYYIFVAYVSIRQHTSAYVILTCTAAVLLFRALRHSKYLDTSPDTIIFCMCLDTI